MPNLLVSIKILFLLSKYSYYNLLFSELFIPFEYLLKLILKTLS